MTRAANACRVFVALLILFVLTACRPHEEHGEGAAEASSSSIRSTAAATPGNEGFLYGRITVLDGATYEGRLRWGGQEEAFWGDYFNGTKSEG